MRPPHIQATAFLALTLTLAACAPSVIQRADLSFEPEIPNPAFAEGEGPVVQIDEAHSNFHTADGRYSPFAKLLRRDGYVVQGLAEPASAETLSRGEIYVIANAIAKSDVQDWKLPTEPAFTRPEIEAIHEWVEQGGSLFLIADHMPMPGAVEDLAAAFGLLMHNGFLYDVEDRSLLDFTLDTGLADHPITRGRDESEKVEAVRTFTGQAFRAMREVEPLLTVPSGSRVRLPIEAWDFEPSTPSIPADGMLQGAVLRHGEGRVAVFGEAAMFTAQEQIRKEARRVMGMNHPEAAQNPQFLLNVMHWLSGLLDPVADSSSRVSFARDIQPILEAGCRPCHFEGGKMYEDLPFDQPETIRTLGEQLFTRIQEEEQQALIRAFLAQEER